MPLNLKKIHSYDEESAASWLSQRNDYDLDGAIKAGFSYKEVIDHLNTKEVNQDKYLELLLCPPKYLSADTPNNVWMKRMSEKERVVDIGKSMAQFHSMYSLFAQDAMVYLLPPKEGLNDQCWITNAAMILPHLYKTAILSNFKAEGRPGEEDEVSKFLTMMEYDQIKCPYFFEGEAELKALRDNLYIGGYGQRTDIKALQWIEDNFNAQIIKIKETDPLRYHLDCNIFCLNRETILYAKDQINGLILKQMEKWAECVPITRKSSQWSLTNSLRIGSVVYNGTDISELKKEDEEYEYEKKKNEDLEKICRDYGLSLIFVNMSEAGKLGAALSCAILHLTYVFYPR